MIGDTVNSDDIFNFNYLKTLQEAGRYNEVRQLYDYLDEFCAKNPDPYKNNFEDTKALLCLKYDERTVSSEEIFNNYKGKGEDEYVSFLISNTDHIRDELRLVSDSGLMAFSGILSLVSHGDILSATIIVHVMRQSLAYRINTINKPSEKGRKNQGKPKNGDFILLRRTAVRKFVNGGHGENVDDFIDSLIKNPKYYGFDSVNWSDESGEIDFDFEAEGKIFTRTISKKTIRNDFSKK